MTHVIRCALAALALQTVVSAQEPSPLVPSSLPGTQFIAVNGFPGQLLDLTVSQFPTPFPIGPTPYLSSVSFFRGPGTGSSGQVVAALPGQTPFFQQSLRLQGQEETLLFVPDLQGNPDVLIFQNDQSIIPVPGPDRLRIRHAAALPALQITILDDQQNTVFSAPSLSRGGELVVDLPRGEYTLIADDGVGRPEFQGAFQTRGSLERLIHLFADGSGLGRAIHQFTVERGIGPTLLPSIASVGCGSVNVTYNQVFSQPRETVIWVQSTGLTPLMPAVLFGGTTPQQLDLSPFGAPGCLLIPDPLIAIPILNFSTRLRLNPTITANLPTTYWQVAYADPANNDAPATTDALILTPIR